MVVIPPFGKETNVDLQVPCTFDFNVASTKYFHGLDSCELPLNFLFSGTVFGRGSTGFTVEQVPWDREERFDMPVSVWRDLIRQHFPNTGWVRLDRDTIDALAAYRSSHGLLGFDDAISSLLAFVRITSHPRLMPVPLPTSEALEILEGVLAAPCCRVICPGDRFWFLFSNLCRDVRFRGGECFRSPPCSCARSDALNTGRSSCSCCRYWDRSSSWAR